MEAKNGRAETGAVVPILGARQFFSMRVYIPVLMFNQITECLEWAYIGCNG